MSDAPAVAHEISSGNITAIVSLTVAFGSAIFTIIRYRSDTGLSRRSERALRALLKGKILQLPWARPAQPFVSFRLLRYHVGGYSDEELRRLLLRCGALRFSDVNGVEYWALLSNLEKEKRQDISSIRVPTLPTIPVRDLRFFDEGEKQ